MKRIFFLLLPVFAFSSCDYFHNDGIHGNGNEKTESRSVGSFNSIDAGNNFDIHITQGPAGDVTIKTDENLMPLVLDAVEQYCTLGEIADTLRLVFGEYK